MSTSFDPAKLNNSRSDSKPAYKTPRAERIQMVVTSYEAADGHQWAVGHRLNNPDDLIRARLSTADEAIADMPNMDRAAINRMLAIVGPGEEPPEFARETLGHKSKAKIKYLQLDGARFMGKSKEDGMRKFRAWWPVSMTTSKDAEFRTAQASIVLSPAVAEKPAAGGRPATPAQPSRAFVDVINSAVVATPENFDASVLSALAHQDAQGHARNPSMLVRICHEGVVAATTRIFPEREGVKVHDPVSMKERIVRLPLPSEATLAALRTPKTPEQLATMQPVAINAVDTFRVAEAGVKGLPMPQLMTTDKELAASLENIHAGISGGHLKVELVDLERIEFGPDTGSALLARRDSEPFKRYRAEFQSVDGMRTINKFARTTIFFQRHESNGQPYVTFANPTEQYPFTSELKTLRLSEASTPPKPAAEASQESAAAPAASTAAATPAPAAPDAFDFGDAPAEPQAEAPQASQPDENFDIAF